MLVVLDMVKGNEEGKMARESRGGCGGAVLCLMVLEGLRVT
jgi:hypothetical protein